MRARVFEHAGRQQRQRAVQTSGRRERAAPGVVDGDPWRNVVGDVDRRRVADRSTRRFAGLERARGALRKLDLRIVRR